MSRTTLQQLGSSIAVAWILANPLVGFAQPAEPVVATPNADATAYVGWLSANKSDIAADYDDWANRVVYGSISVGWHWTEHLQTHVEAAADSEHRVFADAPFVRPNGGIVPAFFEHTFSNRTLSVLQSYQFLHNAWVHPIVGAGVEFNWERHQAYRYPQVQTIRVADRFEVRQLVEERRIDPDTAMRLRAVGTVGFKAYFTERAYFRSDFRVTSGRRLDHVVLRAGVGVEF